MANRYSLATQLDLLRSLLAKAERNPDLFVSNLSSSALYAEAEQDIVALRARLLDMINDAVEQDVRHG